MSRFWQKLALILKVNSLQFQVCYPGYDTAKLEDHIFRMYDSNGDGHIDFREFMIVLYVMSNGSPEENLKQVRERKVPKSCSSNGLEHVKKINQCGR